ncbi:MAG: squalene/phytoene synthase [Thiomonas sp. 14-64-326]|jgi:phytoene synthase|uniref:Squalene/phytoene synthase n=1 Tax=Thiomonas intermedia (strain K12) TaxID=75379 RepID=D5X1N5_THIK1|nr:squalene/phytoene synthase family protein [Thiomonas sp.]OZB76116.1 MAG: squalene/phytoene synthase [Thiomonas sp. 14-64-326]
MPPPQIPDSCAKPPPGSSTYYALQRCPPARRAALTLLLDVHVQVRSIVTTVSDPAVAQAKLAWWHAQMLALDQDQAEHPSLRALGGCFREHDLRPQALLGLIESVDTDLRQNRWMDRAALVHYCRAGSGQTLRNAAALLGLTARPALDAAEELGVALRLTSHIRHLGRDVAQGRVYLPLDALQRHGVKAVDLQQRVVSPPIRALLQEQTTLARAALSTARSALAPYPAAQTAPLLALGDMSEALLSEIERADFAVLHQRISLTPLRKLWISRTSNLRRRS